MIEVVRTAEGHLASMAPRLRESDYRAMATTDKDPLLLMLAIFHLSVFSRVAMEDGKPLAVWGVFGSALSGIGEPWLFATPEAYRWWRTLARIAKTEMAEARLVFSSLQGIVHAEDERAQRFVSWLGFAWQAPVRTGNGSLFWRYVDTPAAVMKQRAA